MKNDQVDKLCAIVIVMFAVPIFVLYTLFIADAAFGLFVMAIIMFLMLLLVLARHFDDS